MKRRIADGVTATRISLKDVAAYVGFSPATVSVVLNRAPQAGSIPPHTQEKIFAAARKLNYRPNPIARALRTRTTASTNPAADVDTSQAVLLIDKEHLLRAIDAIREAGLRIPGDVLVMGMDQPLTERYGGD